MDISQFVESQHQAAGHAGTLSHEDGSIFAKLTTDQEVDFYTKMQYVPDLEESEDTERMVGSKFRDWMPRFLGVLEEGIPVGVATQQQQGQDLVDAEIIEKAKKMESPTGKDKKRYILLENLLQGYENPSLMDIKLGDILYDDKASEEKKARMIKVSEETTSGSLNFRICGMKLYKVKENKQEDQEFKAQDGDYTVFNKYYGRSLKKHNVIEGIREFFQNNRLSTQVQLECLEIFHTRLQMLYNCLLDEKMQVISGSLFFVIENDLKKWEDESIQHELIYAYTIDEEEEEDDDEAEPEAQRKLSSLNFIDFAHAKTGTKEIDERVIIGVENLIKMVEIIKGQYNTLTPS